MVTERESLAACAAAMPSLSTNSRPHFNSASNAGPEWLCEAANIMVAASHNHSGPAFEAELKWGRELVDKLGIAAAQAAKDSRSVTIGYGEDQIGFNINRRKVINGRAVVSLNPA